MNDSKTPLTISYEMTKIEEILARLEQAMRPKVTWSNSLEEMREEADNERMRHIVAAYDMLRPN